MPRSVAPSSALGRDVGSGVKGQAILLDYAAPTDAPQVFAGGLHVVPHDDGTVAVAETRLDGARDHIIMPTTHTGMLISRNVAEQIGSFLRRGEFLREE